MGLFSPVEFDNNKINATDMFTDRDEPQNAFWKKYEGLRKNKGQIDIIHYYGDGGMGKTTLLKKLEHELGKKNPNVYYHSFEINQDKVSFLLELSRMVSVSLRAEFPVFAFAYIKLMRAKGMDEQAIETQIKAQKEGKIEETLKLALTVGSDFVPLLGNTMGRIGENLIDQFMKTIRNRRNGSDSNIARIKSLDPATIYKELHEYFAIDCAGALKNATEPFVIMLDGYEYINDEMKYGDMSDKEGWIAGAGPTLGIIRRLPNVLWVVAGRRKINWDIISKADAHLLGNLSREDTASYFKKSRNADNEEMSDELIDGLCKLTGGTPVYMDLCNKIFERGRDLKLEDFGRNTEEIAARYLGQMSPAQQTAMKFLCALPSIWTDNMVDHVCSSIPEKRYDTMVYQCIDMIKEQTFVTKKDNEFTFQSTLRNVVRANTDPEELRRIEGEAYGYLLSVLGDENENTANCTDALFLLDRNVEDYRMLSEDVRDYIGDKIPYLNQNFLKTGEFLKLAKKLCDSFEAPEYERSEIRLYLMHILAKCYSADGNNEKAIEIYEEVYRKSAEYFGEDNVLALDSLIGLSDCYRYLGQIDKAVEMAKKAYDLAVDSGDESVADEMAFKSLYSLACGLGNSEEYEAAAMCCEIVYKRLKEKEDRIGIENLLRTVKDLSFYYSMMGEKEKSAKLTEEAYEIVMRMRDVKVNVGLMVNDIAMELCRLGETKKGVAVASKLYESVKAELGDENINTFTVMGNLAEYHYQNGDFDKAVELGQKAYEGKRSIVGEDDEGTRLSLLGLSNYYQAAGHLEKAEELRKRLQ